jgi:hypothetical protein
MKQTNTNAWDFLTKFFFALINKGVILPLLAMLFAFIMYMSLPDNSKPVAFVKIIESFEHWHILGWIIAILNGFGWFYNSKFLRSRHADEMNRIAKEKTQLQEKIFKNKLSSSKH